jgi:hypothetical protein
MQKDDAFIGVSTCFGHHQGRGEEWNFMAKVYKSNKMVRSEGLGLNPECNMSGKIY